MERLTAFPFRADDGEYTRLLAFARVAAALLDSGFAPPTTVHAQHEETVPYDREEHRLRLGDAARGFEVVKRTEYVELGSTTHTANIVAVEAYGLPSDCAFRVETVRRANHPQFLRHVTLSVEGQRAEEVVAAFRAAFPGDPLTNEELDVTLRIARSYLREPMWLDALAYARVVLARRTHDARAMLVIGVAAAATGHLDEAEEELASLTRADADNFDAWYNLGRIHFERHRFDDALRCFEAAVAADPENHPSHLMRAQTLERLGRKTDALAAYERAVATSPNPSGAFHYGGMDFTDEARAGVLRLRA